MTEQDRLASAILCSLDFAVLLHTGPKTYRFFGEAPLFYTALFPSSGDGPCSTPWEFSPMLEFFLDEAEAIFTAGPEGTFSSGV